MAPDPSSVYEDDQTIEDDEVLYRLILPSNTKYDGTGKAVRAATNAFQDYPEDRLEDVGVPAVAVSVFLSSVMSLNETSIDEILARRDGSYGLASITAGEARAEDQGIVRCPTTQDPEHGMIFCLAGARKSGGESKRLAKASTIVRPPPPVLS